MSSANEVRQVLDAYKASGYRDPEFDSMLAEIREGLGASDDEVFEILSDVWDSGIIEGLDVRASALDDARWKSVRIFKKANQTPEFEYVEALFDSLKDAITRGNVSEIQDLTKRINNVAKVQKPEYNQAIYEALQTIKAPTETIDDMPVMRAIKSADGEAFAEVKKIHEYGRTRGFVPPGGTAPYVFKPGSANEVADLVKELKKPMPDPKAVERFRQVASARVGLWGRDADAARQMANLLGENQMRELVAKLNLSPAEEAKLVNNFILNQGPRAAKLAKQQEGFLGSLSRLFSASKGGSAMEKLKDAAKVGRTVGGPALKALYIIPRALGHIPRIGKYLKAFGYVAQTALMGSALYSVFGDDEPTSGGGTAPLSGTAPAPDAGPSALITDPAITGNLHQKMRGILKRTFGPR